MSAVAPALFSEQPHALHMELTFVLVLASSTPVVLCVPPLVHSSIILLLLLLFFALLLLAAVFLTILLMFWAVPLAYASTIRGSTHRNTQRRLSQHASQHLHLLQHTLSRTFCSCRRVCLFRRLLPACASTGFDADSSEIRVLLFSSRHLRWRR